MSTPLSLPASLRQLRRAVDALVSLDDDSLVELDAGSGADLLVRVTGADDGDQVVTLTVSVPLDPDHAIAVRPG